MIAHTARAHARLSPSASARWMACPGSVRLSEGFENKSSVYADEGTAAHELAEACIRTGADPAAFLHEWVNLDAPPGVDRISRQKHGSRSHEITDEMVDAVTTYLGVCFDLTTKGGEHRAETRLDLSFVPGMEGGTADFIHFNPDNHLLTVVDLKYGKGVAVDPRENPQLLCYGMAASRLYHNQGVGEVELVIVQPRAQGEPVKRWRTDIVDLWGFQGDIEKAALLTTQADAPLVPGDKQCRFCPASSVCPALKTQIDSYVADAFDEKFAFDPAKLAAAFARVPLVKAWVSNVEKLAHEEAAEGRIIPGYKLVAGRATRKWKNEEQAIKSIVELGYTKDELYDVSLKSPAAVEKLMARADRKGLEALVDKKSSKVVLAPVSDPRPAVSGNLELDFAD